MVRVFDFSVTEVALAALSAICSYRYLSVKQVAVITGLRPKSASEMLLRLERQKLLGFLGNVGIRGYGKTPKLYFLTKTGHRLLSQELEAQDQPVPPYKQVTINSRWSPLMYHRVDTLDVMAAVERDCRALQDYRLVGTLVEYRREQVKGRWRRETSDYVADPPVSENRIVPDAGFALEHRGSGKRALFLIEVDRGTTRHATKQADEVNTMVRKFAQYDRYLASGRIRDRHPQLGQFAGFHVLIITTGDTRIENMRQAARTLNPSFHHLFRFSSLQSVRRNLLHDGYLGRDHADHTTYPLIKGN